MESDLYYMKVSMLIHIVSFSVGAICFQLLIWRREKEMKKLDKICGCCFKVHSILVKYLSEEPIYFTCLCNPNEESSFLRGSTLIFRLPKELRREKSSKPNRPNAS